MAVVRIDLEINDKGDATIRKTSGSMRDLGAQTKGTKTVLDSLFAGIGQGVGQKIFTELQGAVKAFATAVIDSTVQLAKMGSHLADLSAKSGASTQSLQKLGFAGSLVGVSLDQISASLPKMQRGLVDGNKAFGQLGLAIADLRRMEPDRQFAAIADKISSIRDPAEQSAAAIAIFGKSGAELLPLMKSDISGVADEAERLGIVLDRETIDAADRLDDALTVLDQAFTGLQNQLAAVIVTNPDVVSSINLITGSIGALTTIIKDNRQWLSDFVTQFSKLANLLEGSTLSNLTGLAGKAGNLAMFLAGPKSKNTVTAGPRQEAFDPNARFLGKGGSKVLGGFDEKARARANQRAMEEELALAIKNEQAIFDFKNRTAILAAGIEDKELKRAENLGRVLLFNLKAKKTAEDSVNAAAGKWADELNADREKALDLIFRETDAIQELGAAFGGAFGAGVSIVGSVVQGLKLYDMGIKSNLTSTQKWAAALQGVMSIVQGGPSGAGAGALHGAATGAAVGTSIMPGIGTVVGAVAGGILGFFSGGARRRREQREAAAAAKKQAAADKEAARVSGVGLMESGLVAGIKGLGTGTAESAKSQATLLSAVFWTTFREKGLLGAIDAFKASFEQLTASGFDVAGILGPVGNIMAAGVNETFRAAAEGAQGFQNMLHGFIQADIPLTIEQFSALGQQAQAAMEQARAGATEAGLGAAEANKAALAAVSPLLQELLVGSAKYGVVLDANTLALIEQARAAGLAFPTDPMTKMVDLLGQIVLLLGGAIPAAAGAAAEAIGNLGAVGGIIDAANNFLPESPFPMGAAKGMGPVIVPNMGKGLGPLIQTHAGEGVMIVPTSRVGRMPGLFHAKGGFSRDAGDFMGGGSGTGGGIFTPAGGSITASAGTITITPQGGNGGAASQSAVEALTQQIATLQTAVAKAAQAQPINVTTNAPISVEQNPLRIRESAVEAEEFAAHALLKQLQRRNADLVAEIRAIQREGR